MDRQEGYYWVKFGDGYIIAQFTITQKMSGKSSTWSLFCDENAYVDEDFEHINENRIKSPGELQQYFDGIYTTNSYKQLNPDTQDFVKQLNVF